MVASSSYRRLRVCPALVQGWKVQQVHSRSSQFGGEDVEGCDSRREKAASPRSRWTQSGTTLRDAYRTGEAARRFMLILQDLGPLYLPTEYPDAALGVPGTMFKKEQGERYLREVGVLVKWLRRKLFTE